MALKQLGGGGYVNLTDAKPLENESNSVQDFMYGTIWPRIFKTMPPNLNTQTSFAKQLDIIGNFVVDDAALADSRAEQVPTATGLIVWQPNRGAGSCYRMGIVPQGATSTAGTYPVVKKGLGFNVYQDSNFNAGTTQLFYGTATALPYGITNTNDVLSIGPPLEASFSQVRVYSGDLRVICDSTPIGLTALNGVFSCGAFSDSTDVSQVPSVAGAPGTCFNPTQLVQTSVTTKDGLKEVSAMKGIVSLVGSDIQPFYATPNTDIYDEIRSGWTTHTVTPTIPTADMDNDSLLYLSETFLSPWNVSVINSSATNINVGPINLNGVLDIRCNAGLPQMNANQTGVDMNYIMTYTHIFACVTSNTGNAANAYSVIYQTNVEQFQLHMGENGVDFNNELVVFVSATTPRFYQQTFNGLSVDVSGGATATVSGAGGMYLGTLCTLVVTNQGHADATGPIFNVPTSAPYVNFQVAARSYYGQGELGPTRVIRWDAMSNQQLITVNGKINCQCIPEGKIAPFVQPQAMYMPGSANLNAMTLLSEIFNGNTEVRRNWDGPSYDAFTRKYALAARTNPEMVVQWGPENPKLMVAAHAAGIFDRAIHGMVGSSGSFWNDLHKGFFGKNIGEVHAGAPFGAKSPYRKKRSRSKSTARSGAPFGAHAPFGAKSPYGKKKRGGSSKASSIATSASSKSRKARSHARSMSRDSKGHFLPMHRSVSASTLRTRLSKR